MRNRDRFLMVKNPPSLTVPVQRRRFLRSSAGFAAPEVALLALLFIGIAILVGNKLVPAMKTAASCLNTELAGGLPCKR